MKQILTLIMVMFCVTASAQNTVVADTIDAESLAEHKPITQHKWSKYEYVDTCTTPMQQFMIGMVDVVSMTSKRRRISQNQNTGICISPG